MADAVYQALDRMVPALEDLVVRGIFTQVRCLDGMGWMGWGRMGRVGLGGGIQPIDRRLKGAQCVHPPVWTGKRSRLSGWVANRRPRSTDTHTHSCTCPQDEVRAIAAKRRDFEFLLRRRTARKVCAGLLNR